VTSATSPLAGTRTHTAAANGFSVIGRELGEDWPYPAVRFFASDIDEAAVLKAATDDDKRTELAASPG